MYAGIHDYFHQEISSINDLKSMTFLDGISKLLYISNFKKFILRFFFSFSFWKIEGKINASVICTLTDRKSVFNSIVKNRPKLCRKYSLLNYLVIWNIPFSFFQAKKALGDQEGASTKAGIAAFDTLIWQALASVIIPGNRYLDIHTSGVVYHTYLIK